MKLRMPDSRPFPSPAIFAIFTRTAFYLRGDDVQGHRKAEWKDWVDPRNAPRLDRAPRPGTLPGSRIRELSRDAGLVAAGLLLLWHDHWNAAHEVAQSREGDPDHDLLHALAHRREGDYGNAAHWFRGAGNHPCFDLIPARLEPLLARDPPLFKALLPDHKWDARAFLEAVRKGRNSELLRAVQAEEYLAFFQWLSR